MNKEVEQKLIDAARELFYEKGFSGTTVRDIASKAEVNLALLHYYFRTKDKIFEIIFQEALSLLFGKLNKALVSDKDIFSKIEMMVEGYVSMGMKYPQLPLFVMHELSVNTGLILSIINNHKDKSTLNSNFEQFYLELKTTIANRLIKEINPNDLCTDIQSLSLYPFIAKTCLLHSIYSDKRSYNRMLKERVKHVTETIVNNIKL